jgi:hypothetical protein
MRNGEKRGDVGENEGSLGSAEGKREEIGREGVDW